MHEQVLPAIILDYVKTGKAYLVFRQYPLPIPQHVYSRPAAALAVAAAHIGKFQTVDDVLFRDQAAWSLSGDVWGTVSAVLTPEERKKVQPLAQDPAVLAEVQEDVNRGMTMHVSQTPTLMVTHKLRTQPWTQFGDYKLLKGYLDALLKN
jgi:protein-disulfide isomerase